MQWNVHGERAIYESHWVGLGIVDVEIPGISRFDHHVVHAGSASGTIVVDDRRRVLLMWRHRFITDTWGWEIPAGRVDPGESAADAATRETVEETGWRPGPVRPLVSFHPSNGLSDQTFHIFEADGAVHESDPTDPSEAARLEWLSRDELRGVIGAGEMTDGLSLTACCYWLAFR